MEEIKPGKFFAITYKLFRVNDDGTETLVHEVTADDPDTAICGLTAGFVEALEENLVGKHAGDTFDFIAVPEKAFGPYSEEEIYTVPREQLTVEGKFDPTMFNTGAVIPLMTPDGYQIAGTVLGMNDEGVILDLNHPLAKNKVHYVGQVTEVRQPTDEELQPAHGCGGGCGGGCCGSGDDCGCDSNGCGGGCCQ